MLSFRVASAISVMNEDLISPLACTMPNYIDPGTQMPEWVDFPDNLCPIVLCHLFAPQSDVLSRLADKWMTVDKIGLDWLKVAESG